MNPPEQEQSDRDYGQRAVEYPISAVLDDSVAADPLQSKQKGQPRKKRKARGQTVFLVAAGFPGYDSEAAEIEAIKSDKWDPHTEDFRATAARGFFDVSKADEFFYALGEDVKGKIARVVFIGHGSSTRLGLSGRREGSRIRFNEEEEGILNSSHLDKFKGYILKQIQPKLDEDATIDLVSCDSAAGPRLMQAFANAFKRCVRGFPGRVYWDPPIDKNKTAITNRGRTSSDGINFHKGITGLQFAPPVCPEQE